MKRMISWSLLTLLLGIFFFYSCTTKDDVPQVDENLSEVTFEFDAQKVFDSKATEFTKDYYTCVGDLTGKLEVLIDLNGKTKLPDPIAVELLPNGKLKTAPQFLLSGDYTVNSVIVTLGGVPIYAGVMPGANFATFIPNTNELMTNKTFTVTNYTKPTINLWVLCAKGENATNFGMPKFELNMVDVTCFDLFFNVCDENGEHQVGEGTIEVYSADGQTKYFTDEFGEGNIGTICFPDYRDISDNDAEKYMIKVTVDNTKSGKQVYTNVVSVNQLKNFKNEGHWNPAMNAIHVVICGTSWCIFCPPVTECAPLGVNGTETFDNYADVDALKNSWPWDIKKDKDIVVDLKSGILPDKYIYVSGEHQGDITWESPFFSYTTGDFVSLQAAVKKISGTDGAGNTGGESFDAWLHVNLIDANNKEITNPEWKVKMQSNTAFTYADYTDIFKDMNIKSGCYKLQIRFDIQSGSKEKFEFKMDNVNVGKPS